MNPVISEVKERAAKFHTDLTAKMVEKDKKIDQLRLKVLDFKDFYADGESALKESKFFNIPENNEAYTSFLSSIRADGGGDEPENGLEALSLAIKSEWTKDGDRRRHVIVMFSDASAHKLEYKADSKPANYPQDMPANMDELTDLWEGQSGMNNSAKRLLLFTRDAYPWTDISNHWSNTIHFASRAGEGLQEIEYEEILNAIASSV
jgi:hypothetical protein